MSQPPHSDWSRWIFASLSNHYYNQRQGIPLFIEGQYRSETVSNFAQFRIDGPFFEEINYAYWKVELTAAILIQIVWNDQDLHKLQRMLGVFQAACDSQIGLFRYGEDSSKFGCLNRVGPVRTNQLGQIQSAVKIAQGVVEARYQTHIHILG
jgi:hypothetical protein